MFKKMRKSHSRAAAVVLSICMAAGMLSPGLARADEADAAGKAVSWRDGVYEGTGEGRNDKIKVHGRK